MLTLKQTVSPHKILKARALLLNVAHWYILTQLLLLSSCTPIRLICTAPGFTTWTRCGREPSHLIRPYYICNITDLKFYYANGSIAPPLKHSVHLNNAPQPFAWQGIARETFQWEGTQLWNYKQVPRNVPKCYGQSSLQGRWPKRCIWWKWDRIAGWCSWNGSKREIWLKGMTAGWCLWKGS